MSKKPRLVGIIVIISLAVFLFSKGVVSSADAFRFVSWGDTKTGTAALSVLSNQAKALSPEFTIYTGDLIESGSGSGTLDTWKNALNGGTNNGTFDITFPVRGNHDSGTSTLWPTFFDLQGVANRIGATNYTELNPDATYSFDYGNSHFVGIDVLGDVTAMSAAAITWLDNDLTAAESRGLTHAFLFWHGPIYAVDDHCCPNPSANLVTVLNKHPIISATFHGHEHVIAYTHIDSSRISTITHPFEEFVTGAGGAGRYSCRSGRSEYCYSSDDSFATIDVSGTSFTVNFYRKNNTAPLWTRTFTKSTGPDTQAPTAPTNLTATDASATQVNLSWTASSDNVGVTGYKIFRGGSQIGTSATNSYSDTPVQPATSYSYYVTAYDAAGNNSSASNTAPVTTPCAALPTDKGVATTTINLSEAGTYKIWSRVMAPDTTNNSYYLQVDGDCGTVVGDSGITANTWTWVDYKDGNSSSKITMALSAGSHSIKMIGKETGVRLDRLIFTTDQTCIPIGTGDNCLGQPVDTTPPVRSNGSPSGALSAGTTQTTISLNTDEAATCKYATSAGVSYASMPNTFTTTGSTSHSTTVTGLTNGGSYTYYARCQDKASPTPNTNTDDFLISFTVSSTTTKVGDLNGDDQVDIYDLSTLISRWGSSDAAADLNDSGTVDIYDLSILLSNWGS